MLNTTDYKRIDENTLEYFHPKHKMTIRLIFSKDESKPSHEDILKEVRDILVYNHMKNVAGEDYAQSQI